MNWDWISLKYLRILAYFQCNLLFEKVHFYSPIILLDLIYLFCYLQFFWHFPLTSHCFIMIDSSLVVHVFFVILDDCNANNYFKFTSTGRPRVQHTCPLCPYFTFRRSHLQEHLLTHSGERPFACSVCEKTFRTKSQMRRHETIHKN